MWKVATSEIRRPVYTETNRAGFRSIHSFDKQNSKNALIVLMFFAAVWGLTPKDDRSSRTSAGDRWFTATAPRKFGEGPELGQQESVLFHRIRCGMVFDLGHESPDRFNNRDPMGRFDFAKSGWGLLTMINDYGAELGWRFEANPRSLGTITVSTMALLPLNKVPGVSHENH